MHWNIRLKMLAAFGSVVVIMIVMASYNWIMLTRSMAIVEEARDRGYTSALLVTSIRYDVTQVWQWLTDISATRGAQGYDDGLDVAESYAQHFYRDVEALRALNPDDGQELDELVQTFDAFYDKGKWMAGQYIAGGPELGNPAMSEFDAYGAAINASLDQVVPRFTGQAEDLIRSAIQQSAFSRSVGLGLAAAAVLLAAVIAVLFSNTLAGAVGEVSGRVEAVSRHELPALVQATHSIAAGDLSIRLAFHPQPAQVRSQDEVGALGQAFNHMITQLQDIGRAYEDMIANVSDLIGLVATDADQVNETSQRLADAAQQADGATAQIYAAIQAISGGSLRQVEMTEETRTSVTQSNRFVSQVAQGAREQAVVVEQANQISSQMMIAIRQVAESAQAGAAGAVQAAHTAGAGAQTVAETIQDMQKIKTQVDLSAARIKEMGQHSDQIGAIVATIEEIAGQTNLRALNAAIEAARAGEHGKGFAVVAAEVRKLAEHSGNATRQISRLIQGLQATIAEAVQAMDAGAVEMERGLQRAGNAGQALADIQLSVEKVNQQVETIAASAEEISASSGEMAQAMQAVRSVVEAHIHASEEMAANSTQVNQAISAIAVVSQENHRTAQDMERAGEQLRLQVEQVNASMQALYDISGALHLTLERFKLAA
ncbi:MAG: HAMP domain-containing methyl-accepting chemotaxis protein [Anaerolineaceae bacterium]|nr:HAMP domain-containing methyl-accepting chemotaxis protein [Anaerolineaceae bacterium]